VQDSGSMFRKFKKGFYVFFDVSMCNIVAKFIPCLIILATIAPAQVRAEIEIRNAISFNDLIAHEKSLTLSIHKELIGNFSKFYSSFNESLSFFELSWNNAEKKSREQDREKDEAEFFKYLHFFVIPLRCI
jgi:hypothetical protein